MGDLAGPCSLEKVVLSREKLFAVLRSKEIEHLGQVRRAYMETSGQFSIYMNDRPVPGLSIMPVFDTRIRELAPKAGDCCACGDCGNVVSHGPEADEPCRRCGGRQWTEACLSINENTSKYDTVSS